MSDDRTSGRKALVLLTGGFTLWSIAFVALYTVLSIGCAFGWDAMPAAGGMSVQRLALLATWALSLAALAAMCAIQWRLLHRASRPSPFVVTAGFALTALALVTTIWNFGMITVLSACT